MRLTSLAALVTVALILASGILAQISIVLNNVSFHGCYVLG